MFLSFCVLDDFFRFSKNLDFWVFLVHPTVVSVLLSASVERCFVSRMRTFFRLFDIFLHFFRFLGLFMDFLFFFDFFWIILDFFLPSAGAPQAVPSSCCNNYINLMSCRYHAMLTIYKAVFIQAPSRPTLKHKFHLIYICRETSVMFLKTSMV